MGAFCVLAFYVLRSSRPGATCRVTCTHMSADLYNTTTVMYVR